MWPLDERVSVPLGEPEPAPRNQGNRSWWAPVIDSAGKNPLALFALMTLAGEGSLAIALKHSRPEDDVRIFSLMVAWLVVVVVSVTWMTLHNSCPSTQPPGVPSVRDREKAALIEQHRELVIDAEKPRLSRDDLSRQLQQLRLVLNQAPRYSTPTYFLDKHLSIIQWNVAFELIFKPILPKIRRQHVNHFIAELANRDAVFDHARAFTEQVRAGELPLADLEPLVYNSETYGMVEFEKVATQLTDADANLKAWAVALFLRKIDWDMYAPDLQKRLRNDKLWGIYAVSYDAILPEFTPYRHLLEEVIGGIPNGAGRVLELGAGTGKATKALLQRGYRVTAVDRLPSRPRTRWTEAVPGTVRRNSLN